MPSSEVTKVAPQVEKLLLKNVLHPIVLQHAYQKFLDGHLRNAVLDAFIAVFEFIRERTGLGLDGAELVGRAFSLTDPLLIVSELETESGKSDQKGFIQILQGAYLSVRNPKAHSLKTDLNTESATQYLVFASLLARRIDECKLGTFLRFDGVYIAEHYGAQKTYIRFYEDGEVLVYLKRRRTPRKRPPPLMNWLTKENAPTEHFPRGTFRRNGKHLKFSTITESNEVKYDDKYEGEINGERLKLTRHRLHLTPGSMNEDLDTLYFTFEGRPVHQY
jgi:uncharacterized protein (TIGR02391 family)